MKGATPWLDTVAATSAITTASPAPEQHGP